MNTDSLLKTCTAFSLSFFLFFKWWQDYSSCLGQKVCVSSWFLCYSFVKVISNSWANLVFRPKITFLDSQISQHLHCHCTFCLACFIQYSSKGLLYNGLLTLLPRVYSNTETSHLDNVTPLSKTLHWFPISQLKSQSLYNDLHIPT